MFVSMRTYPLLILVALCSACSNGGGSYTQDTDPSLAMNTLLVENGCSNCHAASYERVGPPIEVIAELYGYTDDPDVHDELAASIANGLRGKWGGVIMPKQWQLTPSDADALATAILAFETQAD
ncbi:MAG: c-type cytochrome [Parvularculaceae bacterium]|nr:c-type cytochrome [Parvularculaceae bacterium]